MCQQHICITIQHQWELKQKKKDKADAPKVKNSWGKTMENTVLHLNLMRGMRDPCGLCGLASHQGSSYQPGYGAYLNLDEEMITRAPIINTKWNLKIIQETLDRAYLNYQVDTFKIDNALVYHILSKVFTDMIAYIYVKQRKAIQDIQAVYFDVQKHFLCPDHMARQATEVEGKLKNSHYDGVRKTWD